MIRPTGFGLLLGLVTAGAPEPGSTTATHAGNTITDAQAQPDDAPQVIDDHPLAAAPRSFSSKTGNAPATLDPLHAQASSPIDPYGDRPPGAPRLSLPQIVAMAMENPAVDAAKQQVEAMEAQLRKARFAWVPTISTQFTLSPGAKLECDDVVLDDGGDGFDFQYCRTDDDNDFNINTISGYFKKFSQAGVRVALSMDMVIPVFTFGKIRYTRKTAEVGVALKQLEVLQTRQETLMRVHQAYAALKLARESLVILRESNRIAEDALSRVQREVGSDDSWGDDETSATNPDRDPDDLYRTELATLEIDELATEARNAEATALAALWALAGKAAPRGFDITDEPTTAYEVRGGLKSANDYKELAFVTRPEARMAQAAVQAREYQERLARANFLPDLGVLVSFGLARSTSADTDLTQWYYNNDFNYRRLSAALALRWQWDFHNKAFDLQQARATFRAEEYRRDAARLLLGQEVDTAYQALTQTKARIAIKRRSVDLAWKLVISAQQKDTVGGGDATGLVNSLEKWYRLRFELAEAIQQHNHALSQLSRAVGQELAALEPVPSSPQKGGRATDSAE